MILVTGGAGYIGSHTCIELLNSQYDIIVVDNFSNSNPATLNQVKEIAKRDFFVYGVDLLDKAALVNVFSRHHIEAVIHFAGFKAVGESVENPLMYYHNNVVGTLNLCEVMKHFNVKQLVFSSSATVYGASDIVPISEDFPLKASSPYGRTKVIIEDILYDLCISDSSWNIKLLRYFNPIGAHESGRIGEEPKGTPNNLMPYITQVAAGIREILYIYGSDYNTHDGTAIRDYIHVMDLARGHIKALEKMRKSSGIDIYNLGTGNGYSVLDLVKSFEKATQQKVPYIFTNRRQGDCEQCYADASKAKRELDWIVERSLEEMCKDSWNWQIKNKFEFMVENNYFRSGE